MNSFDKTDTLLADLSRKQLELNAQVKRFKELCYEVSRLEKAARTDPVAARKLAKLAEMKGDFERVAMRVDKASRALKRFAGPQRRTAPPARPARDAQAWRYCDF